MKYFVSGGYTDESGIIPVAYYKRYNLRANLENQIRSWFKLSTNLAYSDYTTNGIISGTSSNRAGVILSVINTPTYAPVWNPANPTQYYDNFYGAQVTSPVENMSRTANNVTNNNRFVSSVSGEISFSQDLKLKSTGSLDRVYYNSTSFLDPNSTAYGRSLYGSASDNRSLSTIIVFDNVLSYDKKIDKHTIGLMGGTSYTGSTWNQSYMNASHFANSDIKTLNAANEIDPNATGTSASDWTIMSYLGRLTYNYDSKYLLTVNFRSDGSSKLAPAHRWGYFPSASAAWRISSEEFMKGVNWVDDLKLRGGWGKVGNQSGIGDYSYLQLYNINRIDWWVTGNTNAVPATTTVANMQNVDLTWETTTQSDIGFDLAILKSRINLSVDAYYKYTTNLLMNVPLPSTAPVPYVTRNEGEMSNKGIEFTLNTKNLTGKFKWETDYNMSFNRNKVEKLTLQQTYYFGQTSMGENMVIMKPGLPLGVFYGYISKGVDPETGDIMYQTKNGVSNTPALSDRTIIGDPNPKFTYGMTNNFSYMGFSLNVFLQGSYGNDIYNVSRMETEGMYDAKNQSTAVLDRWERPGMITYMPRATQSKQNLLSSTRFVEDGSYLRLKTLTFSYNVSGSLMKKLGITRFQPYLTAQNLLTLTKYKGFDPEVNQYGGDPTQQGVDYGTYPQSKSYIIGINVEF
jgi:TonB-linked SusC/RagA family outer membrane protein